MPDWYTSPHLALAAVMVTIGFFLLIKGSDWLVEGAVVIAKKFDMSPAVIGATVVAFGTSLPELVVSVGANLKAVSEGLAFDPDGPGAIAIGNIVGSNIFNIGAILGLSALLNPLRVPMDTRQRDYPIMLFALLALVGFASWGEGQLVSRVEASILFVGLILFTFQAIKLGKVDTDEVEELADPTRSLSVSLGLVFIGIMMLGMGGEVSLTGAIALSREMGLSERVIGLTVMAIGTSLPELATSLQAVRKGQQDIAVANVIGSNIFNVFCILGLSGMLIPLPVPSAMMGWDFWWMFGFSASIAWCVWFKGGLGRVAGACLVGALVIYVTMLLLFPDITIPL